MIKEYIFDTRRLIALPGNKQETIEYCVDQWIEAALNAIRDHDFFAVALSGGSTPKAIYQHLVNSEAAKDIDWNKVYFFWSDERSVPASHEESNYHMSMEVGGLNKLPIPRENVFRMVAETDIENNAKEYEAIILQKLGGHPFDFVMLGMGEDGHTASLFPHTKGLHAKDRLVVANEVPQKKTWRMSFTFDCINAAQKICIYVIGASKAETLEKVLLSPYRPDEFPVQRVGTPTNKAVWVVDEEAAKNILTRLK